MTALRLNGLTFAYPGGSGLRGVSFELAAGERVGLIGPNGAGKTTLLLAIAGVLSIKVGQVTVNGLDPAILAQRRELPRQVGLLFADSDDQLFHASLVEEVAFGPQNLGLSSTEVRERVGEAIRAVGLVGQELRVPYRMSGGEKKRAALASVLAMRPNLLLLDEPSVFLDPRGRRDLARLLRELGGTQLVATHDLGFVRAVCERVLILAEGRLVADGPTPVILSNRDLLAAHGLESDWPDEPNHSTRKL